MNDALKLGVKREWLLEFEHFGRWFLAQRFGSLLDALQDLKNARRESAKNTFTTEWRVVEEETTRRIVKENL